MGFKAYINVLYCLGIETQVEFGKETIGWIDDIHAQSANGTN